MKVIPGEVKQIVKTVEVGTKYIADDGTAFDSADKCQEYEKKLAQKKKKENFDKADAFVRDQYFSGIPNDDDWDINYYIFKCNSFEELSIICDDLKYNYDYHIIKEFDETTVFPGLFICEFENRDTDNGSDFYYTIKSVADWQDKLETQLKSFYESLNEYKQAIDK